MADVTIVYWRDMPAQVIVGKGRRGTKLPLPERFEQAIDRAAMKSGAARKRRLSAKGSARPHPTPLTAKTLTLLPPRSHASRPNTTKSASKHSSQTTAGLKPS